MNTVFLNHVKELEKKDASLACLLRLHQKKFQQSLGIKSFSFKPNEKSEVVYCYGLEGEVDELKKWLFTHPKHQLIFIEDQIGAFACFLSRKEAKIFVQSQQVKWVLLTPPIEEKIKKVIWPYLFRPFELFISPSKEPAFEASFIELKWGAEMTACLYRDLGVTYLKNVFSNFLYVNNFISGESLKNCFKNIPAILCGAGPSLEKNIDELKELHEKALIFGGGSALTALSRRKIGIHFGVSLDPSPPKERFLRQDYFEIPFFYQSQLSPQFFSLFQGTKICFGDSGGFALERYLIDQLALRLPFFDAGMHVATFMAHIAAHLGCSPIILIGMDGGKAEKQNYIQGVEQPFEKGKRKDPLFAEDRFGNQVATRFDFVLGHLWMSQFAQQHRSALFLNATEGGISMKGIKELSLKRVKEKYLRCPFDLNGHIYQTLLCAKQEHIDQKKLKTLLEKIYKSLKRCFQKSLDLIETVFKMPQKAFNRRGFVFYDMEIKEELFYQKVLFPLWEVWRHFLQKEETIEKMANPLLEKKLQQVLFFKEVCVTYEKDVFK